MQETSFSSHTVPWDATGSRSPGDMAGTDSPVNRNFVAPRTETEQKIAKIWQELLGMEAISIHDNFFQLGADSLKTMQVVARIRSEGYTLQPKDLFIQQTIAKLSVVIADRLQPVVSEENDQQEDRLSSFTGPRPSPQTRINYLIPLKTAGNKVPVYIVCGAGGSALRFRKFANMMDADQPAYALQPPMDKIDLKAFPATVQEIAGRFIEEILINDPVGPYALSGHCSGGIIALEMAQQLVAMGKKIHLLAMFDTIIDSFTGKAGKSGKPAIRNGFHVPAALKNRMSNVLLKIDFETFLLKSHARQSIRYKLDSFKSFLGKFRNPQSKAEEQEYRGLEIFDELSIIYMNACKKYTVVPYAGEVVLFYAKEHYHFVDKTNNIWFKRITISDHTKSAWKRYFSSIVIYEVEGEHSDIFDPLHCRDFAGSLQHELKKNRQ